MAATPQTPPVDSPRQVANKSDKRALLRAIRMALNIQSAAVRHNTQTFNRNRYRATAQIVDYEALKDRARAIKEHAIANLPALLSQLEAAIRARGGHFFLARDAGEARNYIRDVCVAHQSKLVVKGKSMTSEEVRLNHELQQAGIEVAETDLAEFILQVADEQPSHIIAPAVHYSRERITALFKRKFQTDLPLDTGEELTKFARERLREKFLSADAGISGANLIAADTGSLVLVESEGNIRMTTLLPSLHIAIAGVEKVVPARQDLAPFLELLAASGTGQPLTSYTSIIRPPLDAPPFAFYGRQPKPREFHLVLIDNGRLRMREDPQLREALYCIRCSACLNSCANFQTVGGHAFGGETYSGGIGGAWEAGTGKLENARFSELCTGCSRCVPQCPVRIDIPWLNVVLRQRLNQAEPASAMSAAMSSWLSLPESDRKAPLEKQFFANYDVFARWGTRVASLANWAHRWGPNRALLEKLVGLDRRRPMPPLPKKTLVALYREQAQPLAAAAAAPAAGTGKKERAVVFADVFTNYGSPQRGLATIQVLQAAGVDVVLSGSLSGGRAPLSQGMIATARRQARATAQMLASYIEDHRALVVIEPSELALFRLDYRHLLDDHDQFEQLRDHSYEAVEYLWKVIKEKDLDPRELFRAELAPSGTRLFYHSHCQQKTTCSAAATEELLRAVGFDVVTSQVECCGMAGSFGYKKAFYDLSLAVAQDLFAQLEQAEREGGRRTLAATGTSCVEQLSTGLHRQVLHPMELLASARKQ